MPLPDIDFACIRPDEGSRHSGFEELCAQLASLEDRPAGASFVRTGRGGDAGVECFLTLPNGDERGWQAKYVFDWDASLAVQLDKSVRAAVTKHPRLTELIVCLPFDLPDSRPARGKSARQKWQAWKDRWEETLASDGRILRILLWGKSELIGRLAIGSPDYAGRVYYWFGNEALTPSWFAEQFGKSRDALGSRYTPHTNVELPIRRDFLAFARDPYLEDTIQEWALGVADRGGDALRALERACAAGVRPPEIAALAATLAQVAQAFGADCVGPDRPFPLDDWKDSADACRAAVRAALTWVYSLPPSEARHGSRDEDWAREMLYKLGDLLSQIDDELSADAWRLANAKAVLLEGAAGTGKSHLLADVVEHQVHAGRPAVLVLGSAFVEGDPWRQIMAQLDLPPDLQVKHFLASLDAAAQASGVRAMVCVDAINERHGPDI